VISRLVSLEHSHEIKPAWFSRSKHSCHQRMAGAPRALEEEIVVTETGHEVITRFRLKNFWWPARRT